VLGVWPYAEFMAPPPAASNANITTPPRYHNANSYQIISAGMNGVFGTGTVLMPAPANVLNQNPNQWGTPLWAPINAATMGTAGVDDQSNFHDRLLGIGG
jgi:hypothetical protein